MTEPGRGTPAGIVERRDEFDARLLQRLRRCGKRLPQRLRFEITAYGARGVRPLCGILGAGGWAPIHAVRMIEEMGAEAAIGPLLQALLETDTGDPLHGVVLGVLERMGERIVEPMLVAHGTFRDEESRHRIAGVLAGSGARDVRILAILRGMVETGDFVSGAALLAEYGDPAALPALARALDGAEIVDPAPAFRNQAVFEIAGAIEKLGGCLTPSREAQVDRARAAHRRFLAPLEPERRTGAPGRNEPCWCGSGRKYKRCHRDADAGAAGGQVDGVAGGRPERTPSG